MPTLTIDNKTVAVPSGATILEAATAAGSSVPTLCQDNKLHPYGACRICMVEVLGTPRRMVASCTTPVAQGMVIETRSPAVMEARRAVLEFLLINHPLDCPVCDKAGDCRLQDLVHEYGLGASRFNEEKRQLPPDLSSAIIERNANRCILCGKCVRICNEQNAVTALAFTRRGGKSRISTSGDRPLDCEFCGECVEICPVGALGSKQFKHKARTWSLEETLSTCLYCGNLCPLKLQTRKGRVVRVAPAQNNYLCARGRFGWDAVHHEERLLVPKMRKDGLLVDCTWDEALTHIALELKKIKDQRGAAAIGGLGSIRTTNEDNYVFQKFLRDLIGTNNIDLLARLKMPQGLNTAIFSAELASLGASDAILVLDPEAAEINPLTGIEIARAVNQKGRDLILLNSGPGKLNRIASVLLNAESAETALSELVAAIGGDVRAKSEGIAEAVSLLMKARNISIVLPAELSSVALDRVQYLARLLGQTTFIPLVRRGNLQGALDMGVLPDHSPGYRQIEPPETLGMNALEMLRAAATGRLAALYIMGDDPIGNSPEVSGMLAGLDLLVVQDLFLTETAKLAHVVLPAASFIEKSGTVTNLERRLRSLAQAEEPIGESRPDWMILQDLAQVMGVPMQYASAVDIMNEIRKVVPAYKNLAKGTCWPRELSPDLNEGTSLSLAEDSVLKREVIFAGRLLFSSGSLISRSREIGTLSAKRTAEPSASPRS